MKISTLKPIFILTFVLGFFIFFSCGDMPMGMGDPVDLEAPELKVISIVLPDGEEVFIEESDGKLFIGKGILVGPGVMLKGEARDNVLVEDIVVEEIGPNANIVNGVYPTWDNAKIGSKNSQGWQSWSIVLNGLEQGERTIKITAYDRPKNIGPETVKQLTLLVDTNSPIVKDIKVVRDFGFQVDLMPRTALQEMDENIFANIDYFQNEYFTIRASIEHDFILNYVKLNLLNEDGEKIFTEANEPVNKGSIYTPEWLITHDDLVNIDPKYETGRHYFNVLITARAQAGHSGQNEDITNHLYSLCWYPESDIPRIFVDNDDGHIQIEKNSFIPITTFDDDKLHAVYAALITNNAWDGIPASTDADKLKYLETNRENFPDQGGYPLRENILKNPDMRSTVYPLNVSNDRGAYKLVILVWDKDGENPESFARTFFNVNVIEEGIPVITIESPGNNTIPSLNPDGSTFDIKGSVINLDAVNFLRIAWIPAGLNLSPELVRTKGEAALKSGDTGNIDGIIVRDIALDTPVAEVIGSKTYQKQAFSTAYDIFDDYKYNSQNENAVKTFMLYTQGFGGRDDDDVFFTLYLLPHDQPPEITINSPAGTNPTFKPGDQINFEIKIEGDSGVPITSVELISVIEDNRKLIDWEGPAAPPASNIWTAANTHADKGFYQYTINAVDSLGNPARQDITIRIDDKPEFLRINSPHNPDTQFSGRDTITLQAIFSEPVTVTQGQTPQIMLGGLNTTRLANYTTGSGTTILNFDYNIQSGDITTTILTATEFINPGAISANIPSRVFNTEELSPLTDRRFVVNAVAPTITNIAFTPLGETGFSPWLKTGEEIEIRVTTSKRVRVLGNPNLQLIFDNGTRNAGFLSIDNTVANASTILFTYRIQAGDLAVTNQVSVNPANCLEADRLIITDTVGGNGNYLSLGGTPSTNGTINVNVDTVVPGKLTIAKVGDVHTYRVTSGIAVGDKLNRIEFTEDGIEWRTVTQAVGFYQIGPIEGNGRYSVSARQIDRAGNISVPSDSIEFTIGDTCALVSLVCDMPDGAYNSGTLEFKLIFSGKVLGNASITLAGGNGTSTGAVTIPMTLESAGTADFILSGSWTITSGRRMLPVTVTAIDISGVTRETSGAAPDGNPETIRTNYNDNRNGLSVLSVVPTITNITRKTSVTTDIVLTDNNFIELNFSHAVTPERGYITIKPETNWVLPPVLTNEEFIKISNALPSAVRPQLTNTALATHYVRTTHGIKIATCAEAQASMSANTNGFSCAGGAGHNHFIPDTDTKYVLNYTGSLQDATLKGLLENQAGYLHQRIEVVSQQVTGGGTSTIRINLPSLPNGVRLTEDGQWTLADGRQWTIAIDDNAFRDDAGNMFAAWNNGGNSFWSENTAPPVIRVERVSNNRATENSNLAPAVQTNVRYRIDCETPGATIYYGEHNGFNSTVSTNTSGAYGGITTDGAQNSGYTANATVINDVVVSVLTGLNLTTPIGAGTNRNLFGQAALLNTTATSEYGFYRARKDYIAARATRTGILNDSGRSYEGAFKTVIVYRNPDIGAGRFIKTEGADTENATSTIAGFPLKANDMSGQSSRYAYKIPDAQRQVTGADDWVFITWEIVSKFWHVGMQVQSDNPGTGLFNNGMYDNSWSNFPGDHYNHNFRKYGNWGLRIGG
ncbi:MAG: hypothetical protein LBU66_08765 [Treponema sp.]|jgi:hypothetical protein|nr:hypothetical protein [Treponema sp.]